MDTDVETKQYVDTAPCAVCGEKRPQSAIEADDPYCSAGCCMEAYRVPQRPLEQYWTYRKTSRARRQGPLLK
jgi:hypothetical protein